MSTESLTSQTQPEALLAQLYQRHGYMRVPNETRRKEEGSKYKKGYEIRLVAKTQREIAMLRRLLRRAGLKGGKPFKKHNRWVQPIYGKQAMDRFRMWLEEVG